MSKLQKKPSALKRGHPTLKNMNFYKFFFYFCGSFLPSWIRIRIPNPDPDPLARLNTDPIRIRIPDPDPKPCEKVISKTTTTTKFLVVILKVTDKNIRNPEPDLLVRQMDPDPHQHVTVPQHCF
jgi:hypothetical protein